MLNNILFTGGSGRLADEVKKHLDAEYVGIEQFDFVYPEEIPDKKYDLVVHAGAYTDVRKAETEQQKCMMANVMGTFNMVQKHRGTPFIYISTEWAHNPLGVYALSKQLGEEIIKTLPNYMIMRTLFKPNPWPFDYAYEDQWTQGDYVDVVAKILAQRIKNWDGCGKHIEFLGTGRKTILELAQETKPDVKPNKVSDYTKAIGMDIVPLDYE